MKMEGEKNIKKQNEKTNKHKGWEENRKKGKKNEGKRKCPVRNGKIFSKKQIERRNEKKGSGKS